MMDTPPIQNDYAFINGNVNWINKLKIRFPDWLFILPESYKTIDGKMLDGKDKVYFFTDQILYCEGGRDVYV